MSNNKKISIFDRTFWDLWFQKMFRNFASVKYQFMLLFYVLIAIGMFTKGSGDQVYISAPLGLGFLSGGFITLATTRIIMRTKLTEDKDATEVLDTDR